MLGTIMGRLGIGEENYTLETCTLKLMNRTPLNDKTGFNNTKMVTDNCDQKSIMKN